jgi:tetratricopeptide (TPR) repeat protein
MLTSLGDLTGNEECYEEAWVLSKGRFARAKRTLARNCFHRKEYTECVRHMSAALAVHPLVATAWYLMGRACMHIRDWKRALEAFTRCVQQDMEIGEAWANMGAIYMELKELPKAHVSFVEALKQKRDSWKIIENLLCTSLELSKWFDVILYSNMLLDQVQKLKAQSQSPVHIQALRKLILAAVTEEEEVDAVLEKEETDEVAGSSDWSALESTSPEELLLQNLNQLSTNSPACANATKSTDVSVNSHSNSKTNLQDAEAARARRVYLITRVEALLTRITNTVDSDSAVWDAVAVFYSLLNKPNDVKEARVKEVCILILFFIVQRYAITCVLVCIIMLFSFI